MVHVFRIFILTAIVALLPALALPVAVDSQDLVAREPNKVLDWFKKVGGNIKSAFNRLADHFRKGPLRPREVGVVYAREDSEGLYIRELDDDDMYVRQLDDEFEARDIVYDDDEFEAREFEGDLEGRDELDARGPRSTVDRQRREFYDQLD